MSSSTVLCSHPPQRIVVTKSNDTPKEVGEERIKMFEVKYRSP